MAKQIIVTQAYGLDRIKREAVLMILSFFYFTKSDEHYEVIVYTDDEAFFGKYLGTRVRTELLTPATIIDWKGPDNFVHRLKVKMLQDCSGRHPGKFIYLDSDTFFKQHPSALFDRISDKSVLMHTCEDRLENESNLLLKKIHRFLQQHPVTIGGEKQLIPGSTVMWNAGVIGMETLSRNILSQVLTLTDELYAAYPKHVMEQLAFSYFLQNHFNILAADDVIEHYWPYCKTLEAPLEKFCETLLPLSFEEKCNAVMEFDWKQYYVLPEKETILGKVKKWFMT